MTDWTRLNREEQLRLREAFGHYLDTLPPACSLDMKIARFQDWLSRKGIQYDHGEAGPLRSGEPDSVTER
ncbi:MAG: hypothetical protein KZQ93_20625 [Candidatus Thiodiazotropha sp. (ex Monitilora ramsayi)]|nr:hypothetical protein [Candidatus Thiodiazotropha sp. (ex Monitilora ramsayi)]